MDAATGADTLVGLTARAEELGYEATATVVTKGRLRCSSCDEEFPASEYGLDYEHRLEGASDPADMALLLAGSCPRCGARSTVVLGFGPNASEEDADVLLAVESDAAIPLPAGGVDS